MISCVQLKINIQVALKCSSSHLSLSKFALGITFRMKVPLRNMKGNVGHLCFFELNTEAHIMICFYNKFSFWLFFFKLPLFKLKFALNSPH